MQPERHESFVKNERFAWALRARRSQAIYDVSFNALFDWQRSCGSAHAPEQESGARSLVALHRPGGEARGDDEGDERGEDEAADDGDRERTLEVGACTEPESQRREASERRCRGHDDRAQAATRGRDDRVFDRVTGGAEALRVLEEEDAILDDEADEEDEPRERRDVERRAGEREDEEAT
jgi:hypothetical protein